MTTQAEAIEKLKEEFNLVTTEAIEELKEEFNLVTTAFLAERIPGDTVERAAREQLIAVAEKLDLDESHVYNVTASYTKDALHIDIDYEISIPLAQALDSLGIGGVYSTGKAK